MKEKLISAAIVTFAVAYGTGEILLAIAAGYYEIIGQVWAGKEKRP